MKIQYIKLPTDNKRRKYFDACGLIYVHYPEYAKVTKEDDSNYYLKVTYDTWEEHLLKGIKSLQEISEYGPIVKLSDGNKGITEEIVFTI